MNEEKRQKYERPEGVLPPLKAIRAKCLDCMCGQYKEVTLCPSEQCPLYAYRFGRRPKGEGMDMGEVEDAENIDLANDLEDETDCED